MHDDAEFNCLLCQSFDPLLAGDGPLAHWGLCSLNGKMVTAEQLEHAKAKASAGDYSLVTAASSPFHHEEDEACHEFQPR